MLDKTIRFFLENKLIAVLLLLAMVVWGVAVAPFSWNINFIPRDPVHVGAMPPLGKNQQIVYTEWVGVHRKMWKIRLPIPLLSNC